MMALPLPAIAKTLGALTVAVAGYLSDKKSGKALEDKKDFGGELADLQAHLDRQAAFISTLTAQVESLVVRVEQQARMVARLKLLTYFSIALTILLITVLIWVTTYR